MSNVDFQFLFADRKDIFFASPMLKLDFEQYLYLKLKRDNFKYVYYFNSISDENLQVCCETYEELCNYCEKNKRDFWHKKKKMDAKNEKNVQSPNSKRLWYGYEQPKKKVLDNIEALLLESCAFVFSMQSFNDIFTKEDIQKLEKMLSKNKFNDEKSIFLFIESETYSGNLAYLPETFLSGTTIDNVNSDMMDSSLKKMPLFDRLKSQKLESKCKVWSIFEDEQIRMMIKRAFLSHLKIVDDDVINRMTDYIKGCLADKRIFEVNVNSQRDLFYKILLDQTYIKRLQEQSKKY